MFTQQKRIVRWRGRQRCRIDHRTALTFCCRHSLQARFTGCLFLSSRASLSSTSSILPGELSIPAIVTLRLRPCTPSEADMETGAWLIPAITGLVAARALSFLAPKSRDWVLDPPIALNRPRDARLMALVQAGSSFRAGRKFCLSGATHRQDD